MAQSFDATYPTVARWVLEYRWIEIGQDEMNRLFIRALDEGGMVWEGQEDYATLDDAFIRHALEIEDAYGFTILTPVKTA